MHRTIAVCLSFVTFCCVYGADLEPLEKQLKSKKTAERIKAAEEIGKLGKEGKSLARALCEAATDKNADVQAAALEALEKVRPELYKTAVTLLIEKDIRQRTEVVKELPKDAGPLSPIFVLNIERTEALFKPEDKDTSRLDLLISVHLLALARIAPEDKTALQAMIRTTKSVDKYGGRRKSSLEALGTVGESQKEYRKEILDVLMPIASVASKERFAAIVSIGKLGPDAKAAIPLLKKLKLDSEATTRGAATMALASVEK